MNDLPEGFVLDQPATSNVEPTESSSQLPEGFVLDSDLDEHKKSLNEAYYGTHHPKDLSEVEWYGLPGTELISKPTLEDAPKILDTYGVKSADELQRKIDQKVTEMYGYTGPVPTEPGLEDVTDLFLDPLAKVATGMAGAYGAYKGYQTLKRGRLERSEVESLSRKAEAGDELAKEELARRALTPPNPTSQTPLKQDMAIDPLNADYAEYALKNGRVYKNPNQTEALRQGFKPGVVSMIREASPIDKRNMLKMVNLYKLGQKSERFGAINRPSDIIGNSLMARVNYIMKTNKSAGKGVDTASQALKGTAINTNPIKDNFMDGLEKLGVKTTTDSKGKVVLDFSDSLIRRDNASQSIINNIHDDLFNRNIKDGYALHNMKRVLSSDVSYEKAATGISGDAERFIKGIRSDINTQLGNKSPMYAKANQKYSDTSSALKTLQKSVGTKIDLKSPNASKALGTSSRKLLSNYNNRVEMIDALSNLDKVARQYGLKIKDDLVSQVVFNNEIDRMFGAAAKTSLKGQMSEAMQTGIELAKGKGVAHTLIDLAKQSYEKATGINEEGALKAIETLLKQ